MISIVCVFDVNLWFSLSLPPDNNMYNFFLDDAPPMRDKRELFAGSLVF